ncbi:hypothetical protein CCHR01_19030 [Colletotrichum chrysophilum]|uniref:Uncharacterized protein n=1 Tax=Colletotrichum chrysophilum TaxID=1836956 RepID=A0AAD9E8A9_9PEZI|nr:hypothetical protein CCHR01_19030 [Colletotrichum chrysophilum]
MCDYSLKTVSCIVPQGPCLSIPDFSCPWKPKTTQEMCCCCDPTPFAPNMRCAPIAKNAGCFCASVKCPFNFDDKMLPPWYQGDFNAPSEYAHSELKP